MRSGRTHTGHMRGNRMWGSRERANRMRESRERADRLRADHVHHVQRDHVLRACTRGLWGGDPEASPFRHSRRRRSPHPLAYRKRLSAPVRADGEEPRAMWPGALDA